MSDVIVKYVFYIIFENKRGGRFTPMGVMPYVTLSEFDALLGKHFFFNKFCQATVSNILFNFIY